MKKTCATALPRSEKRSTARLNDIASRQGMEAIGDVRGLGAMVAFELVTDRDSERAGCGA